MDRLDCEQERPESTVLDGKGCGPTALEPLQTRPLDSFINTGFQSSPPTNRIFPCIAVVLTS
jgi:hypothetical protein